MTKEELELSHAVFVSRVKFLFAKMTLELGYSDGTGDICGVSSTAPRSMKELGAAIDQEPGSPTLIRALQDRIAQRIMGR